jgi:hypothetical protein
VSTHDITLFVVEDDPKTSAPLVKGLFENRFVVDAAIGGDGLRLAGAGGYDLVVLDALGSEHHMRLLGRVKNWRARCPPVTGVSHGSFAATRSLTEADRCPVCGACHVLVVHEVSRTNWPDCSWRAPLRCVVGAGERIATSCS